MKPAHATAVRSGSAFCAALLLAVTALIVFGTGTTGLNHALQLTARFSFVLFWLAYCGGALATLFGSTFEPARLAGRDFGLSFAAAHLVHLGLVIWLYQISLQPPVSPAAFWFFTFGVGWIYVLALFSIRPLAAALGHLRWRMLRLAGMEYISLAFLVDFAGHPLHGSMRNIILYVPFAVVSVIGSFLRFAAWASRSAAMVHRI